ncbi:hypothetical protein [Amycolatopsis sp. NPDC102389]|uniref:hypothetical protein n=1 Tax=Amycolatopsis sp. NPDC102389 TaxID=3363941 RepID=UPI00381869D0
MMELDLAQFVAAVHAYAPKWEAAAIQRQLTLGPDNEKSAAWVVCETQKNSMPAWTISPAG